MEAKQIIRAVIRKAGKKKINCNNLECRKHRNPFLFWILNSRYLNLMKYSLFSVVRWEWTVIAGQMLHWHRAFVKDKWKPGARREPGKASGGGVEAGFNLRMLLHLFRALNCPALWVWVCLLWGMLGGWVGTRRKRQDPDKKHRWVSCSGRRQVPPTATVSPSCAAGPRGPRQGRGPWNRQRPQSATCSND